MNIEDLQESLLAIPREYYLARRRYASALRRGDLKTAQAWLDIAEREMALVAQYERADEKRLERHARAFHKRHAK